MYCSAGKEILWLWRRIPDSDSQKAGFVQAGTQHPIQNVGPQLILVCAQNKVHHNHTLLQVNEEERAGEKKKNLKRMYPHWKRWGYILFILAFVCV
jgi:hypothetical protein